MADPRLLRSEPGKWSSLARLWPQASPAAPSPDDIASYARLMRDHLQSSKHRRTIVLLGVTPGLRRALATLDCDVHCIDVNAGMIEAARSEVYGTETFICRDWLTIQPGELNAVVVVGDKVFDNLPPRTWPRFKESLLRCLGPGGQFITRLAPQDRSLMGLEFRTLLEDASRRLIEGMSTDEAVALLWERALGASATEVPGVQSLRVFMAEITALAESPASLTQGETLVLDGLVSRFGASFHHEWYSYSLGHVVDLLAEELRLTAVRWSSDYPAAIRQPILAFEVPLEPNPRG